MFVIVALVVLVASAALMDFQTRRRARRMLRKRRSAVLLAVRHEPRINVKTTVLHRMPLDNDWHKPISDRLTDAGGR